MINRIPKQFSPATIESPDRYKIQVRIIGVIEHYESYFLTDDVSAPGMKTWFVVRVEDRRQIYRENFYWLTDGSQFFLVNEHPNFNTDLPRVGTACLALERGNHRIHYVLTKAIVLEIRNYADGNGAEWDE